MLDWLVRYGRRTERIWLAVLLATAIALRALLVMYSPQPYGYVWDFYHEGVHRLYATGHLPASTDCWQCYQPPLFFLLLTVTPVYLYQFAAGGA